MKDFSNWFLCTLAVITLLAVGIWLGTNAEHKQAIIHHAATYMTDSKGSPTFIWNDELGGVR